MRIVIASFLFNVFWFLAVAGQDAYIHLLGLFFFLVVIFFPVLLLPSALIALVGIAGDVVLVANDILIFPRTYSLPLWLIILWLGFGYFLCYVKDWIIQKNIFLLIGIGAIGGFISYLAGARLGAVEINANNVLSYLLILFHWCVYSIIFLFILKYKSVSDSF